MNRAFTSFCCAALLAVTAFAQEGEPAAKFLAADVHPSIKTRNSFLNGPFLRGTRYEMHFATLLDMIAEAYHMDNNDVFGGPSWLEMNQYDLIALVPEHTKHEETRAMLRQLLAERFHLAVHKDTKPMPAYAITAPNKASKLKEASEGAEHGCKGDVPRVEPPAIPNSSTPARARAWRILWPICATTCRCRTAFSTTSLCSTKRDSRVNTNSRCAIR